MPIKPQRLSYGDTVGIVAPASPPRDPKGINLALAVVEKLGFKVKLAPNARKRWGFLAGSDRDRAADLMKMFIDPKVRAILCLRGGYGAARLLPLLDYRSIKAHPKIFIGYSDITALHCALLARSNLISFHGPMLTSDFLRKDFPQFSLHSLLRALMEPTAAGPVSVGCREQPVTILRPGKASGRLLGGNLTILCATLATPFQPSFRNAILFFEEVDEAPYRLDRMLTQLLNAGLLQQVSGIAVGRMSNCREPGAKNRSQFRQTAVDVLRERLLPLRVPIVSGIPFGHAGCNATLPVGARATLNADDGDLWITESAVQ